MGITPRARSGPSRSRATRATSGAALTSSDSQRVATASSGRARHTSLRATRPPAAAASLRPSPRAPPPARQTPPP
eukprot:8127036-Pyramimonas_sp.AAC.1